MQASACFACLQPEPFPITREAQSCRFQWWGLSPASGQGMRTGQDVCGHPADAAMSCHLSREAVACHVPQSSATLPNCMRAAPQELPACNVGWMRGNIYSQKEQQRSGTGCPEGDGVTIPGVFKNRRAMVMRDVVSGHGGNTLMAGPDYLSGR